ncbi:MAG TPA: TonB-dependent receptor [Flavisolibacter sp.]|nr:TonB-dependent receptor [Flavisolibacter sp.]
MTALFFGSQLSAQQDTTARTMESLVLTATKTPIRQDQTGKVVTVIDQATIQRNIGKTVSEILNYSTGIFINGANNAPGTNQDFYFRGAGTGKVLVLMDGIPVMDPSQINNSFDLNSITPSQIERIEILRGAQSTLWGSDAMAGVVNIITKKGGSNRFSPNVLLSYGSYQTCRSNAGVNGRLNAFDYNLSYSGTTSKGFSAAHDSTGTRGYDKDGFEQNNLQASLGYQLSQKASLRGLAQVGKYTTDLDAGAFTDDRDFVGRNRQNLYSLDFGYTTGKTSLHFINSYQKSKRTLNDDSTHRGGFAKYAEAFYHASTITSDLFASIRFSEKASLLVGSQGIWQNTDQGYFSLSSFGPFRTKLGDDSARSNHTSLYASFLLTGLSGFNNEIGFRYNNHNIYGSNATYSFNPSYNIDASTRVFLNISSGFKIPSLYQLFSQFGNKALAPEKSHNYELGGQLFTADRRSNFRVLGFKRDIKNLIISFTNPATFASNYINRDEQHDYGFEMESNIGLGSIGNWSNNFTYVDGRGKDLGVEVRNLFRRPNFTFNSVLTLQPTSALTVMPSFRFVGTRLKGQFDFGPNPMPQYYMVDFYAAYNVTPMIRAFVDLRNITNQQYFDVPGYNSRRFNFMAGVSAGF